MADQQLDKLDGRWLRDLKPDGVEDVIVLDPANDIAVSERLRTLLNGAWLGASYRLIAFDSDKKWVRYDRLP